MQCHTTPLLTAAPLPNRAVPASLIKMASTTAVGEAIDQPAPEEDRV